MSYYVWEKALLQLLMDSGIGMPGKSVGEVVGKVIIGVVLVGLIVIVYYVVSGQWGGKRFRGIEKFRGDHVVEAPLCRLA